jgi:hypothetical protein
MPGIPVRAGGDAGHGSLPQPLRAAIEVVLLDHELELCDGGDPNLAELAYVYGQVTGWHIGDEGGGDLMGDPTANQLVAYNLMRIRKTLGLDQAEAAARLVPYLGVCWSKAVYSAAERSYDGKRVRQFTADDLLAMSLAFGVPVAYFFLPDGSSLEVKINWDQVSDCSGPAFQLRLQELDA